RDAARKRVFDDLPVGRMRRLGRKLERLVDQLRANERPSLARSPVAAKAVRWAVDARVVHRAGCLRSAMAGAGAAYLPERLHTVRMAVKKVRYAVELSSDVSGTKKATSALRTLKRGQDMLGRMHDLQVLIERIRELQASLSPPSLAQWREQDELVVALED